MKKQKSALLALPMAIWLLVFVLIPIGVIVYYGVTVTGPDGNLVFSLSNFARFADETYLKVFLRSIKIALYATVICLVLGYPVAYICARGTERFRTIVMLLLMLPMWMNFLLRTYAWLSILENSGLVNRILGQFGIERIQFLYSEGSVIFGTVYNFLPFMILPIQNVLLKMDDSLLEAAYDLGATPVQRFLRIVVPFSVPGVISGITMTFVPSVTTFVVSQLMGGGKVPLVGDIIERQFRVVSDWHFGSAVSVIVMIVIISMMVLMNKVDKSDVDERGVIL